QWIVNYLNENQREGAVDLGAALRGLNPEFSASVVKATMLDDDTYLIGPAEESGRSLGAPFIAARQSGQFVVIWRMPPSDGVRKGLSKKLVAGTKGYLPPWSAEDDANNLAPDGIAGLGKLRDTANGDHRFFIDTVAHHENGAMFSFQLTIWRWHAGTAT